MKPVTSLIPELRFPEFQTEWNQNIVDWYIKRVSSPVDIGTDQIYREIGVRSHGKGLFHKPEIQGKKLGGKRVFWIQPNAFIVNIVFAWEQAVALTSERENGFIASHRFPMFTPRSNRIDLQFLLRFFLRKKGKNLLELASPGGAGRNKTLGQSEFSKLKIIAPRIEEQQKIAAFLTSVDEKLNKLHRKHELLETYKRGLMQKLFSQEMRFKQDDGSDFPDWQIKPLKLLANRCIDKNINNQSNRVLTNSATQGIIDQQDYFDKEIANNNNLEGYYLVELGDFVYNPRISASAPVGPIKRNTVGLGVMSPLYSVFRFNVDKSEFHMHYFDSTHWHKYMYSVANFGARYDRMNITNTDFMNLPLPVPSSDEQEKIVKFLNLVAGKVLASKEKIEQLETFKKALLQKMFV